MRSQFSDHFNQNYQTFLKHLKLKGLQPKTIAAYSHALQRIGAYFGHDIDTLTEQQMADYFAELIQSRSWSTAKHDYYSLMFYYAHVIHQDWPAHGLIKPPKAQRLPDILTVDEASRLFNATRVLSYRVFFFTLYSLGLRIGEGLQLQVGDIDSHRLRVHIRNAKGNKDRLVPLPQTTLTVLRHFWSVHRHPTLLFPNRRGGLVCAQKATTPLNRCCAQLTLRKVAAQCGIKKRSPLIPCAIPMLPI